MAEAWCGVRGRLGPRRLPTIVQVQAEVGGDRTAVRVSLVEGHRHHDRPIRELDLVPVDVPLVAPMGLDMIGIEQLQGEIDKSNCSGLICPIGWDPKNA